jgi:uncharacterized protein YcfL
MKSFAIVSLVSFLLSGCSLVPAVAQKAGLGAASDEQIVEATAKQFGVATAFVTKCAASLVQISWLRSSLEAKPPDLGGEG